jgi:signal transduction histidine kinase
MSGAEVSEPLRAERGRRSGVALTRAILGQGLLLTAIAALIAIDGSGPGAAARHLYLVPTIWAAFTAGAAGGGVIGGLAGLLHAPVVLPAVERIGLTGETVDGLISLGIPLACGWIVGALVDHARGRAARLRTVLEMQRSLSREVPLEESLREVAERVRVSLDVDRVGLVVGSASGDHLVAGAPTAERFDEAAAAGFALRRGRAVTVSDLATDPRIAGVPAPAPAPVRGLALPLDSGSGPVGALAIERVGDLPAATRAAAQELAMHLALAIDNVRLTLRQRRFAEELEDKVAAATARLRELDQAKNEFLSVVAHELRTPLTALQGFSELLLSRALPPERATRFLTHLHGEAGRLGRIVAELLDLSRIEAGRGLELRREAVDLGEIIERNVELFATEHRRHRFEWALSPAAPPLSADRDAVDRMLKNLLSNAVKYSPRGGRVSVAAGPAPDCPGMLELSVEDDGVGIPAAHLPRIFERYVRVPHPETAAARGLGLGLCLVRALAEAHGGHVAVESLPGKGSRFRVLLPA